MRRLSRVDRVTADTQRSWSIGHDEPFQSLTREVLEFECAMRYKTVLPVLRRTPPYACPRIVLVGFLGRRDGGGDGLVAIPNDRIARLRA